MPARLKLTVTSPPQTFEEPLTVADMIPWLDLPEADQTRTVEIETAIASARAEAELRQGRDLVGKQYDLTFDSFPCVICLRENVVSIDEFRYRDSDGNWTVLTDPTDYLFDSDQFIVTAPYGRSWPYFTPWPSSAVFIRFTVSPPPTDPLILKGMRCLVIMEIEGDASPDKLIAAYRALDAGRVERV